MNPISPAVRTYDEAVPEHCITHINNVLRWQKARAMTEPRVRRRKHTDDVKRWRYSQRAAVIHARVSLLHPGYSTLTHQRFPVDAAPPSLPGETQRVADLSSLFMPGSERFFISMRSANSRRAASLSEGRDAECGDVLAGSA